MVQMHYFSLFVILHFMSISSFPLTESEMEEMDKVQQNNLATTMTTVNETTLAAEKMNLTKLIKFIPSWTAFMVNLDNSKDLATNTKNLEILCMNASVSTGTEGFNTNAISENIHSSMNASEVFESTHPSMNESEVSENSTSSIRTFETEAVNDNQNILEANMEGFSTNPVSGNTHPSISASEASKFEVPDNTHPLMNVSEVPENTHPLMNVSEVSENTNPLMNVSEVPENTHLSMNTSEILENTHLSMNASEILENTHPLMNVSEVSENAHLSMNASEILESTHLSMNASEILENNIPSISAIDAKAFKNNITIEEITTTLSEKTTLEQLESMSSSTLEQTKSTSSSILEQKESTSSSTLEQKESTSSSTVNMNVQLSNRTRSKAISGVIYEETDGVPTKCQSNADCYDLYEPEAWCDLKSDGFWFGQGCYCNEILQSCIIQVWKNDQLYYTDCRRRDQHHCSSNS